MQNQSRRPLATISMFGVTYLHRQNPFMVAWWSAAFPGFGQYLLNQYLRATILTLAEVIINTLAHINQAIMYTFCGKFEMAKHVIQPCWVLGYFIIYLYAIYDSYRSTLTQNKMCYLAELENERLQCMTIYPFEIQYLEQKNPTIAALYSFFFPGLGQLYNHRVGLAFYAMFWWWFYAALSRAHESIVNFVIGNIYKSIDMLHPHWLLFMPSVLGGSVYHAYITAMDHNRIFRIEQRQYLAERYNNTDVRIFPKEGD